MDDKALEFLGELGATIGRGLASFKIPGTNWSALGLMLGCFLLTFVLRLLFTLFTSLNISGAFSSAASVGRSRSGLKYRSDKHHDRANRASKSVNNKIASINRRNNLGGD